MSVKMLEAQLLKNSILEHQKLLNTASSAENLNKTLIKNLNEVYQSFAAMDQNLYHIKTAAEEAKNPKLEE